MRTATVLLGNISIFACDSVNLYMHSFLNFLKYKGPIVAFKKNEIFTISKTACTTKISRGARS